MTITGALDAAVFTIGAMASAAETRIIYNDATGELLYDRDGTGSALAVRFATLRVGLTGMQASDFEVI